MKTNDKARKIVTLLARRYRDSLNRLRKFKKTFQAYQSQGQDKPWMIDHLDTLRAEKEDRLLAYIHAKNILEQ